MSQFLQQVTNTQENIHLTAILFIAQFARWFTTVHEKYPIHFFFPIVFSVHNVCVLFGLCILKCQTAFLSVNTDTRKHEKLQHLGHVSDALRYPGLHMHTLVWTEMRLLFDEAWVVTHRPSLLTRIGTVISRL